MKPQAKKEEDRLLTPVLFFNRVFKISVLNDKKRVFVQSLFFINPGQIEWHHVPVSICLVGG